MYWSIFMIVFAFLWWWPCRIVSKKKKIQITIDTPSGADDCFPIFFFCHFCPFYRFTVLPRAPPPSDFYRFTVLPRAPPLSRFYRFTVLPFYRAPSDLQILPFYRFTVFTAYICTKHALTSRPTQRQHSWSYPDIQQYTQILVWCGM